MPMKSCLLLAALFLLHHAVCTAQHLAIEQSVLIFPLQDKHVHASSIVHLPNGDLLAVWFYGSGERTADDVRLLGARLKKGQTSWSEPFLMADTPNLPDCNPVLFLNQENQLFLVWIAVLANKWEQAVLRFRTSVNYLNSGAPVWNWQDNILLNPGEQFAKEVALKMKALPESTAGWSEYAPPYDKMITSASQDAAKRSVGWMTRIKPLILGKRILLPLYSDGFNFSLMAISDDQGLSWRPSLPVVGRGPIQPAIVQKKNGHLLAFMRDSGDAPNRVQVSESADLGETWTPAVKSELLNTASVELLVLQDGRWAFVGNDVDDGRYRLSLFLSDDEGLSWKWKLVLENTIPGQGNFSYPCLIQASDGFLHLTYSYHLDKEHKSIKYMVLNPAQLTKN